VYWQYHDEFIAAQNLVGAPGFTSARLYTSIQGGSQNAPIEAIKAAIDTQTSLLLGIWASAGQDTVNQEIAAIQQALNNWGSSFTDIVAGISVGSEDLYRISPTGIINKSDPGAGPDVISGYINQVRSALGSMGKPIGHVDTWTAWVNGSNSAVVAASDFLGFDGYPYYQNTQANDISQALNLFNDAYSQTLAASQGKPIWITETGWPTTGPTENQAVANVANAQAYWDSVGCGKLFGKINTWWFQFNDYPSSGSITFGVTGNGISSNGLFDLTCPASSKLKRGAGRVGIEKA